MRPTQSLSTAPSDRPTASNAGPRRDIQGLRMLAVLLVVANHLWDHPRGGFIGVDIFFVLSGFLITSLLLKDIEVNGRVDYAEFYRRRVRRIVPAATLVILATVVATYLIYSSTKGEEVRGDGLWALAFSANWHFGTIGTDYFRNDGVVSPLQHYWSLSVEEQFYLVWPVLLLCGALFSQGASRLGTRIVIIIAISASFGYSLWHSSASPTWAYFSTFDRAWELGVGALIASTTSWFARLPEATRPVLAWTGLTGIAVSVLAISPTSPFPAPAALVPVLSTALIIAAGTGGVARSLWPLTNPVAVYLGDISYSIYLWHFPVMVLLAAYYPDRTIEYYGLALTLTFLLSWNSYEFIENPIRHSAWLAPHGDSRRRQRRRRFWTQRRQIQGLVSVAAATAIVCMAAIRYTAPLDFPVVAAARPAEDQDGAAQGRSTPAADAMQAKIVDALTDTEFSAFTPELSDLGVEKWVDDLTAHYCGDVDSTNESRCTWGDPGSDRLAVVIGDSIAMSYLPGIVKALEPHDFRVQSLALGQCPVWALDVRKGDGSPYPECAAHRSWVIDRIRALQPDLVIGASSATTIDRIVGADDRGSEFAATQDAAAKAYREIAAQTQRLLVLTSPPATPPLSECVTRVSSPTDCAAQITSDWLTVSDIESRAAQSAKASFVDTSSWLCNYVTCPGIIDGLAVRADGTHLTVPFSESLQALIWEAVRSRQ